MPVAPLILFAVLFLILLVVGYSALTALLFAFVVAVILYALMRFV